MKNLFVYKKYTFHRFNESTNEIEFDHEITAHRLMTSAENIRYHRLRYAYILWSIPTVLFLIAAFALIGCALGGALPDWSAGIGFAFLLLMTITLRFALEFGCDAENLLENELPRTGFEKEDAEHKSAEDEVKSYAEIWRAAHPLEEKIRIAKQTGNCVDIAELVRYCGADLVDKLK